MLNVSNTPRFGSDPEAFLQKDNQIVGSEKLIPLKGIATDHGKIVRDGVQFELNPLSSLNVWELGDNIAALLQVTDRLAKQKKLRINFDGVIEVSREELDSLSKKCRILGCMPSFNYYEDRPITVDPVTYRKRSAGGHIHIGINSYALLEDRRRLVPAMDSLIGNTCVLLDRDPNAAERRENYGRAGEHRLPSYGLEYRTTSNFWLRDYALMQFVFGMTAAVYDIAVQSVTGNEAIWRDLAERVDIKKVIKAIDTNDFKLAMRNFKRLVPFLKAYLPQTGYPLTPSNIEAFVGFAENVDRKRIETYFPTESIVDRWQNQDKPDFSSFLTKV